MKSRLVEDTLIDCPRHLNQNLNRQSRSATSEFGRKFTAERLGPGGIEVHRRGQFKRPAKGQPSLPIKMRRAGFYARLRGEQKIDGKKFRIATRNPAMVSHELGLTVRADRGGFLPVPLRDQPEGISPRQREQAIVLRLMGHNPILVVKLDNGDFVAIAVLVKQVKMKARLGFLRTWSAYESGQLPGRLDKAIVDTLKRAGIEPPPGEGGSE